MSKTSDAQKRATEKYHKEKFDEIRFRAPKGEKKILSEHAESCGESLTKFLIRAAQNQMKADKQGK